MRSSALPAWHLQPSLYAAALGASDGAPPLLKTFNGITSVLQEEVLTLQLAIQALVISSSPTLPASPELTRPCFSGMNPLIAPTCTCLSTGYCSTWQALPTFFQESADYFPWDGCLDGPEGRSVLICALSKSCVVIGHGPVTWCCPFLLGYLALQLD